MNRQHLILAGLAGLTIFFFGAAAYVFLGSRIQDDPLDIKPLPLGEAPQALRLTVYQSGIAVVTAGDLRQANLPVEGLSAGALQLTRDGQPVPFYVAGEGRNASLYFYAQPVTDTLDAPAVYWLAPGRGQLMEEDPAAPGEEAESVAWRRQTWEENETFLAQAAGDDVWLGKRLFAPNSLDVALEGIQPAGGSGQLTIRIWSNNRAQQEPDHHIELLLNGAKLPDDYYWDGITQKTITVSLEAGALLPAGNVLTINAPGDTGAAGEALYIDWVRLDYDGRLEVQDDSLWFRSSAPTLRVAGVDGDALVFDVTDPAAPVRLAGTKAAGEELAFAGRGQERAYFVFLQEHVIRPEISPAPSWEPLTGGGRGADYVAIVADVEGFLPLLDPLLEYRRLQGWQVEAVLASQVFDEFGYGRRTPQAIRDFLAYAVAEWEPAPRFVLLVGDASYDLYNFSQGKNQNLLPTYLVYTEFAGYVASDTWFTIFDDNSLSPELAIGRFPAQTAGQLATMVNKTLAYERAAETEWLNRALLVADDEKDFDEASDDLAGDLGEIGYETQKLYMSENEEIRDAIISAL
ncbi:MAG: C25 family cysteine peptidase, partial [Chloroflexi bacterium]|nr:C25 family cysteine peptidase [Chloroflexota bacterium]